VGDWQNYLYPRIKIVGWIEDHHDVGSSSDDEERLPLIYELI